MAMMGKATATTATTVLVLCVLLLAAAGGARPLDAAAACNPSALSPCGGALFGGTAVTPRECCVQLKKQQPCLCQYARSPAYSSYVNSPAAQRLTIACGLPKMKC